jgi:DNA-binding MarR family transcriptional regulator
MAKNPKHHTDGGSERRKQETVTHAEEYDFFLLMSQVVEGMVKVRENELKPYGITPMQVGLMYVVKASKSALSPSQIARRLLRRRPSVHQLLDRMEDQGLVKRIKDVKGKREVKVILTKKGEETYRQLPQRQAIPRILGQLSTEERKQLRAVLEKLRTATYAELAPKPMYP